MGKLFDIYDINRDGGLSRKELAAFLFVTKHGKEHLRTCADIQPGSIIPYKVKVELIVDVPIFGRLTLPVEKTGEIPIPYKPDVDIEKIKFEKFSFEETVATLHLKLENKNDFDLGLNALDFEIWLSGVSIGGAELAKTQNLKKNVITDLDIPITFRPKECGSALEG